MKLYPSLLRACASYLAHDVYDTDRVGELLRRDARSVVEMWPPTDEHLDEVVEHHIDAIIAYRDKMGGAWRHRIRDVARAILDATPGMLAWWAEELARE